MRRATYGFKMMFDAETWISIHALREESDAFLVGLRATESIFQSTLSVRRATSIVIDGGKRMVISIHALREESDPTTKKLVLAVRFISIHALREESDLFICIVGKPADGFQSTLSVRRATEYDGQANT